MIMRMIRCSVKKVPLFDSSYLSMTLSSGKTEEPYQCGRGRGENSLCCSFSCSGNLNKI